MPDSEAERRRKNRERMRRVRAEAVNAGRCREVGCNEPVAPSPRTGKPSRLCDTHLAEDRARKTPPELEWEGDQEIADRLAANYPGGRFDFRKPYRLMWLDSLGRPLPLPRGPYRLRWL